MKRAQYDIGRKAIYLTIAVLCITMIFLYTNSTYKKYQIKVVENTENIENILLISELVTSPKCFAYENKEIERVYPTIIDPAKFEEKTLEKDCMKFLKKNINLTLGEKSIGSEVSNHFTFKKTVLVKEGENLTPKILTIKIEKTTLPEGVITQKK